MSTGRTHVSPLKSPIHQNVAQRITCLRITGSWFRMQILGPPLRLFHCQPQGAASLARRCSAVFLFLPSPFFHLGSLCWLMSPVCFFWPPVGPSLTTHLAPRLSPRTMAMGYLCVCAHHSPGRSEIGSG